MAQLVERILGKDEVTGSIPVRSSRNPSDDSPGDFVFYGNKLRNNKTALR